jgi:hypothetical protein
VHAAAAEQQLEQAKAAPPAVVAITGATGFVGSALVRRLAQSGTKVRVLTRDVGKARRTLLSAAPGAPLEFYEEARWLAGIRGAGAVVNLAGEPISSRCAQRRAAS